MKALSIRHPYITAILSGHRPVEVRAYATRHRGELLLHAAGAFGWREKEELERLRGLGLPLEPPSPAERGALVGIAEVADCHPMTGGDWSRALLEPREGEWWAWELTGVETFPEPIPHRGHIFIWDVPDAELAPAATPAR